MFLGKKNVLTFFIYLTGTGVPAGIGRDLEHLSLSILKRKFFKSTKIKDILHLPQCAPETKLLMVLAFLRLRQGLPGTGVESQVNSASGRTTEKKTFL